MLFHFSIMHHQLLYDSTPILVSAEHFKLLQNLFCHELHVFLKRLILLVTIQYFYHLLNEMICILIFNKVCDCTVFKFKYNQILLVWMCKFECFLNNSASIFWFNKRDNIPYHLVYYSSSLWLRAVIQYLLNNVISKQVLH